MPPATNSTPPRLALNAHYLRDSAAILAAFAEYIVPATTSADWHDPATMERHYAHRDQVLARITSELIAQGAEERIANIAASAFMTFGFAPAYGLDAIPDERRAAQAMRALDAWAAGVAAAYNSRAAAQAVAA